MKVFSNPNSADLAKASLLARGIECWLTTDDCGGMYPFMDAVHGVKLFVRRSDSDAAIALLAADLAAANDPPPDETTASLATTQIAPPRIKLSLPQLSAGIVTGILLCLLYQWTEKAGTKTFRYDTNHDGKTDEIQVRQNGHLIEWSIDRNFDGRMDEWYYYQGDELVRFEADDNFDGKPDRWCDYTNGEVSEGREDTDFNGLPDVTMSYKAGLIQRMDWKPNHAKFISKRQLFRNGVLFEEQRDLNNDGEFDETVQFDAFSNPVKSNSFRLLSSGLN